MKYIRVFAKWEKRSEHDGEWQLQIGKKNNFFVFSIFFLLLIIPTKTGDLWPVIYAPAADGGCTGDAIQLFVVDCVGYQI